MTWMTGNFRMTPARRQTHNSNKYDRQVSGVGTLHHCNCHLLYCTLHYCGYCLPLNDNMSFISQAVRSRQCHHFTLSVFLPVSSHDESLPDTGEQRRRGVGCMCPEVGGLLSPPPAVADWRPRHQWQARLELGGPIRGQAVHGTYVYT